jgi:hypothetical protein
LDICLENGKVKEIKYATICAMGSAPKKEKP